MYEMLLELYQEGRLKEPNLNKAITLGWLTEEQKQKIMASVPKQ